MWLSASAFFNQYWRVYSPISFGQKYDKEGLYIKKYVPELKDVPKKYIYQPWLMGIQEQERYQCILGVDYPKPIVDHDKAKQVCVSGIKKAFEERRSESSTT